MSPIDAAGIYDFSGVNGELLLIILISFGIGALFGRTIMSGRRPRQLRLFKPSSDLSKIPTSKVTVATSETTVIVTPAPRS